LAFPVRDLSETRAFYADKLGCEIGRSSENWVDFSLFGHQLSAHLRPKMKRAETGEVDGTAVPIPHFGVVLQMDDWNGLAERLEHDPSIDWIHKPMVRFKGQKGEQATFFLRDPSGNALEFKGFLSLEKVFEH
jgi:extradiol dioxygenase family protein